MSASNANRWIVLTRRILTFDRDPIGRTPRNNPATDPFDRIREFFALAPETQIRGEEDRRLRVRST